MKFYSNPIPLNLYPLADVDTLYNEMKRRASHCNTSRTLVDRAGLKPVAPIASNVTCAHVRPAI